jgi:hypothetical protein
MNSFTPNRPFGVIFLSGMSTLAQFNPGVLTELLEKACPSIQYRLRLEVLNQPRSDASLLSLQNAILEDPEVIEVLSWQSPDGWLATNFHGYHSMESGIHLLCEKGLDPAHPALSGALEVLIESDPERLKRGLGKPGEILDQLGFGGAQMIRAAVLAYAGIENTLVVKAQIELTIAGFRSILSYNSIDEFIEEYQGKPVFRPGILWPSLYHLRLLAWTDSWRTPENLNVLTGSIKKLIDLSPLPAALVRHKSRLVAPASFCMHDFNPQLADLENAGWMMWFQRMELLARLGVIQRVPELQRQVQELSTILDDDGGWFTKPLRHTYFKKWGAYTGLMLEQDWNTPRRRIYDLSFRCILILHYNETLSAHSLPGDCLPG